MKRAHRGPGIGNRVVARAVVVMVIRRETRATAPYNHFLAGPNGHVPPAAGGSILLRQRRPDILVQVVASPVVEPLALASATPDDHFVPRPHSTVAGAPLGPGCPAFPAPPAAIWNTC